MNPSYATAVLGPHAEPELEGFFDDVAHFVSKGVSDVVDAVDKAAPQWLKTAVTLPFQSAKMLADGVNAVAHGERIDRVLMKAFDKQVSMFKDVAPLVQMGLSVIPGIGQGINAAIGAGLALAQGKPITDALLEAVKSAIPGGPLVSKAIDIGVKGAIDLASGKKLDAIALDAVRRNIPGGEAAKIAFDTGLALAQGKKLQEAGMVAVSHFIPDNPLAHGAFEMTKRALAGKPLQGSGQAAIKAYVARAAQAKPRAPSPPRPVPTRSPGFAPPRPRPVFRPTVRPATVARPATIMAHPVSPPVTHVAMEAPEAPETSSSLVPLALGIGALAAAGGGAWWWTHHRHRMR